MRSPQARDDSGPFFCFTVVLGFSLEFICCTFRPNSPTRSLVPTYTADIFFLTQHILLTFFFLTQHIHAYAACCLHQTYGYYRTCHVRSIECVVRSVECRGADRDTGATVHPSYTQDFPVGSRPARDGR